jgi:protein involved in polysaccharide export with SLBB domain
MLPIPRPAFAARYVVGAGDKLYVDFPLRGSPADLQPLGGNGMTLVIVGEKVFFRYEATVAPDGFIALPSMNPLRVSGMTLEQVRDQIAGNLPSFSLRDTVSVILAQPNSQAFVVSGEVQKPGRFIYERPTSLMEALVLAGGPTDKAQLKRVQVFRTGEAMQTYNFSHKYVRDHGLPSVPILPSDAIIVPRRWFAPDSVVLLMFLSVVTTAATVYVATK